MPMGGGGTRFATAGYQTPKPLIEIYGAPFFYWAVQSVAKFVSLKTLTFVVLQKHVEQFQIDKKILKLYPNAHVVVIPAVLPGTVMTCQVGLEQVANSEPILLNDCDHLFICNSFYNFCKDENFNDIDAGLLIFQSNDDKFSYAECNASGYVIRTIEKQVISAMAICGAYYFKNKELFTKAVEVYLNNCTYAEPFISGVYNILSQWKLKIKPFTVDKHISFGTPEEYMQAQHDNTYLLLK